MTWFSFGTSLSNSFSDIFHMGCYIIRKVTSTFSKVLVAPVLIVVLMVRNEAFGFRLVTSSYLKSPKQQSNGLSNFHRSFFVPKCVKFCHHWVFLWYDTLCVYFPSLHVYPKWPESRSSPKFPVFFLFQWNEVKLIIMLLADYLVAFLFFFSGPVVLLDPSACVFEAGGGTLLFRQQLPSPIQLPSLCCIWGNCSS